MKKEESTIVAPEVKEKPTIRLEKMPMWKVILHNTDVHTFKFVISLLVEIFNKSFDDAIRLTKTIHVTGFAVVEITHKERAELLKEKVFDYGPDPDMKNCTISLPCTIEPE